MNAEPLGIGGAFLLRGAPVVDERGAFTRLFDATTVRRSGLDSAVAQVSMSRNHRALTLRGLHLQRPPSEETKVVRCLRGRAFDVLVDLRDGSPTRLRWVATELREDDGTAVLVPPGIAHGFLTLEDATDLLYVISAPHDPAAEWGVRWDDPAIGVAWPAAPEVLSERDRTLPLLT